jgi:hypothetical protein
MQFKVPQFIDVEDKLFGPFSFKQFAYMAGGAGLIFILYKLLPFWISIFLIIPVAISSKLYIWKQRLLKPENKEKEPETPEMVSVIPMTTEHKLKDLSWSLDVKDEREEKEND